MPARLDALRDDGVDPGLGRRLRRRADLGRSVSSRVRSISRRIAAGFMPLMPRTPKPRAFAPQLPVTANHALPPGAVTNTIGATHGCGSVSL